MSDSQIIKNIIHALMNKGITTPSGLAKSLNYDQGSMSKIFNGKKPITAKLRERLHEVYGINHTYLLKGTGEIFSINKENDENAIDLKKINERLADENQSLKDRIEILNEAVANYKHIIGLFKQQNPLKNAIKENVPALSKKKQKL